MMKLARFSVGMVSGRRRNLGRGREATTEWACGPTTEERQRHRAQRASQTSSGPPKIGLACTTVVALCLTACGGSGTQAPPKHQLEGSLTELMSLGYDDVVLEQTPDDLSVRFVRRLRASEDKPASEDTPLKVTMALVDLMLVAGSPVDLTEVLASGAQRGVLSRNVANDPRTIFPNLARGTLTLASIPMQGQKTRGEFRVTFINGIQPACGHTAYGSFEASNP